MITITDLSFSYDGPTQVFQGLNLRVERNEALAVIGPSGCGKTTLLYLLAGLLLPTRGTIMIDGVQVRRPRPGTGLVLQDHGLLPWATARENALLGLKIRKFYGPDGKHVPLSFTGTKHDAKRTVTFWLQRLGLQTIENKYPFQLSRGQRQRTAIARTMALSPDLLLLDEPFSALDAAIREDLQSLVLDLHHESQLTSIIITHDIDEALFIGRRIVVLRGDANRHAHLVENPLSGLREFRNHPSYRTQYQTLRELIGGLS